ncbi:MAG: DUF6569 family protein [Acidobacteriota bacterium]|nr:DUF6569 family protein [Acidobacteriota bacterium]
MKRRTLLAVLFTLMVGFGWACARQTLANRTTEPNSVLPVAQTDYTLSGPHSHKNLTIFLIHGKNQTADKSPLTLQEALEQKKVVVHETGEVNELAIENRSDEEVYVQSGDIVKGGKQDRVLAIDLIVPPRSGKIPISAFCVEQGRWQGRGDENAVAFDSSQHAVSTKELKIAAKAKGDQSEVWRNVGQAQEKLNANLSAMATPKPAPPAPAPAEPVAVAGGGGRGVGEGRASNAGGGVPSTNRVEVRSQLSASSLQLSLENGKLKDVSGEYQQALSAIINDKPDVIGFAFAINGKLNSADVYASHALFAKLWPKLLNAAAVEAIAEFNPNEKFDAVATDTVAAFLRDAESGKAEQKTVTQRVLSVKRESDKNLFFETRDRKRADGWLHRNYLVK